jgi:hypothetical protein
METMNTGKTLEQLLDSERFGAISGLYNWSTNYEYPTPFTYFLDLIGYSDEMAGDNLADWSKVATNLQYLELDYLADALKEYATIGQDAYRFVLELLEAEQEGNVL